MSSTGIDGSVPASCDRDCGAGCPLQAHVSAGRLERITDCPRAPKLMRGCIKGFRMADTVYAADRLRTPLVRTAGRGASRFREVAWPETLDHIARRPGEIRDHHDCLFFLPCNGSGSCREAVHNTDLVGRRFFAMLGGFVDRCTAGFDDLVDCVMGRSDGQPKPPGWAAAICGVPEATITKLAGR